MMREEVRTSGWVTTTVGEIATLIRGITYNKEQAAKSPLPYFKPVLRANNINGTLNFDDLVFVPQHLISSEQIIKTGDIIFAMSSGSKHLVGKSARARFDFDGSYGAFCGLLRAHEHMDKNFLYYVFQNNKFRRLISEVAKGSNINNLKREHILDFEIALPPLPEQHRIVAKIEELFSELDKGIENLKTARAQLKVYRQALLKHAFEGKLTAQWRRENQGRLETAEALLKRIQQERAQRHQQQLADWEASGGSKPKAPKPLPPLTAEELAELPELPEGWFGARLGWMTCSVEYGTSAKSAETGACPVLRMGNIQNGKFDWTDLVYTDDEEEIAKYLLKEGDVLFNRTNSPELVGKSAIFKSKRAAIFAGYLIRVNQIETIVESQYLNYFLNSHIAKQHGNTVKTDGVNQSNINGEKLVNYPFPFCSLEEQKVIVELLDARLSEVDQLELTITTSLQQAEALRQSILKKAFSGQLVPQDPHEEPASALLERIRTEREQSDKPKRGGKAA